MLGFVDINNELSYQDKNHIPDVGFGLELALKNRPLDFQYQSSESVTTFEAKRVDNIGGVLETISLSTSLISSDGSYHICDGQTDYAEDLECGVYYFIVNSHYQSEYFQVFTELSQGPLGNLPITVSGLSFFDTQIDIAWRDKKGSPDDEYGLQYADNSTPLPFIYLASDAVSSFVAINLKTNEQVTLSTSLITSDGTNHTCTGLVDYANTLGCGIWYFKVNDRFESDVFKIMDINPVIEALLLETGDFFLLETGDKLLLE